MAKLIRVAKLPSGAIKEGEPIRLNAGVAQDYRKGDDLYEHVTRENGEIRIFKVVDDAS